jgi:nitrogen regulatory protein P-II 1
MPSRGRAANHAARVNDVFSEPEFLAVKLITAIIQPGKLDAVMARLAKVGVERMTVCDAMGYGRQRGRTEMYRGHEYKTNLLRKVALEIVVNEDFVERTVETIVNTARTGTEGNIGDGKILIQPVVETIQIGGMVRGPGAV